MSVRSFWYNSNDTKRNPWVMCVHIAQLRNHPAIYTFPFTLQLCYKLLGILQRVTKCQKVYISIDDELQKFYNVNLALYRSHGFPPYTKLFKELAYLSLTTNHPLLICTSGEDRMKKILVGILEVHPPSPLNILFPLFGVSLLIYSCHFCKVIICEILRLWYSDPLYHHNISFYNSH